MSDDDERAVIEFVVDALCDALGIDADDFDGDGWEGDLIGHWIWRLEELRFPPDEYFVKAGELRYHTVKYEHQPPWDDLSPASRQLWVDVQRESHKALIEALELPEPNVESRAARKAAQLLRQGRWR